MRDEETARLKLAIMGLKARPGAASSFEAGDRELARRLSHAESMRDEEVTAQEQEDEEFARRLSLDSQMQELAQAGASPGQFDLRQIQGRVVQVTVHLGQPLGVEVNPDLTVKNLSMGGQLQRLGTVKPGDRILSMGGTTLSTTDQFLSIIRERTNQGQQELDMIFEQVSFHFRLPRL